MSNPNTVELICRLPAVTSLQQLCDLAFQILGNPVFVSDLSHTMLAYTKCVDIQDDIWQTNVVQAHLDRNTLRQDREVGAVHLRSTQSRRPVLVEDSHMPYPRIIKTLCRGEQALGVVVLTAYLKPFGEQDAELLDLVASFMADCLARGRYSTASAGNRAVENYFINLLEGAKLSRRQVDKRMGVLGWPQYAYTYVLVVCTRDGTSGKEDVALETLLEEFSALPASTFLYNSSLVCVYGSGTPVSDWPAQAPELSEVLARWDLIAGVSRRMDGLEQLREYYLQAVDILEVGRRLNHAMTFCAYDELSSFLLLGHVPREDLQLYCHQQIQALADYDHAHGTQLCVTLQVYLEQTKSLSKTADILYIHRNTVRYRINQCMKLLGSTLENGNEIFAYILSLRILEYQEKIARKDEGEK